MVLSTDFRTVLNVKGHTRRSSQSLGVLLYLPKVLRLPKELEGAQDWREIALYLLEGATRALKAANLIQYRFKLLFGFKLDTDFRQVFYI